MTFLISAVVPPPPSSLNSCATGVKQDIFVVDLTFEGCYQEAALKNMGRRILKEKNLCYFGLFFDDPISIFTYIHLHVKERREAGHLLTLLSRAGARSPCASSPPLSARILLSFDYSLSRASVLPLPLPR